LRQLARQARRPLDRFLHIEAASSILLLVATAVALCSANSPWAESYTRLWRAPIGVRVGPLSFERSLEWVVNDGLMVIFFFVVGMEIRREIHRGELSGWRRAALPAAAALGGMAAPAALYLLIAGAPATSSGWGVPMATDIAFAVGILALLGSRVPAALRVLLLALAVIDDLGAILVIAIFYSKGIAISGLGVSLLGFRAIFVMQRAGVRTKLAYVVPALVAWAGVYAAGIHPTVAGVIVGLMTPVEAWLGPHGFVVGARRELDHLEECSPASVSSRDLGRSLHHVDVARREAMSPAESLIEMLHPWVAFAIMPVFALANAGVSLRGPSLDATSWTVASGTAVGLFVGKPAGVLVACWLSLRLRVATLPAGLGMRQLLVRGAVAGVGFTMALFVSQLAFSSPALLAAAKLGVLVASGASAITGLLLGRLFLAKTTQPGIAETADEAESSTAL